MLDAERNYDIYDKELLVIIKALKEWRHYIQGLPHPVEIWTDHKNLEYFMTSQNLTRRQRRWSLTLAEYDFTLHHKPGRVNDVADALSRRPDHREGVEKDNTNVVLLKPEYFQVRAIKRGQILIEGEKSLLRKIRQCNERDPEVVQALETLKVGPVQLRKGLEEWNVEEGLILYRGLVYVPKDSEIRREILKLYHDTPAAGHPGRAKTLELVSRNYWWPHMAKWVHDYVDGCDRCKATKIFPSKPVGPLQPNAIPEGPWQSITCDLIVDLPKSEGFDSIFVVVDRFSKQAHFIPTTKNVDSRGIVDLFLKNIWKLHGTPKQVISDRGTQFVSKFMEQLSKRLGIKWSASTAYHPRTDGQTERVNQEVEQYLRVFSNYRQNDWVSWLPLAEFTHNNSITTTGHTPFKVMYGYDLEFTVAPNSSSKVPAADERANEMREVRQETESTLRMVNERMKRFFDRNVKDAPEYQVGDKVWLDGSNIKQSRPN